MQQWPGGGIVLSLVWSKKGVELTPKGRGAEQGGVDGPLECSLSLGMVAAEARLHVVGQQAAGTVPWVGANNHEELMQRHQNQVPSSKNSSTGADDPRHALQENGHLADFWYFDHGDILWHPALVLPFLEAFDTARVKICAETNRPKTDVIYNVSDLDTTPCDWKISEVRALATVVTAVHGDMTFGVAAGPRRCIADQILLNVDVIRAMHERVQLCQHNFVHIRERPGVSKVKHIFRVHGHMILTEEAAAETFTEVGQGSLERLFPEFYRR